MAIPASGMERYSTALTNLVSKLGIGILHPSSFSSLSVGIGVGTGGAGNGMRMGFGMVREWGFLFFLLEKLNSPFFLGFFCYGLFCFCP